MRNMTKFRVLAVFAIFSLLFSAIAVNAQYTPQPYTKADKNCSNGVQDGDETGVDCGGVCFQKDVLEVCDGKDNDKNCLVDDNCKTNAGKVVSGGPVKPISSKSSCSDSIQNQDETGIDCGGVCTTNDTEICDGIDNNKNCLIDEVKECREATTQPVSLPTSQPIPVPESVPSVSSTGSGSAASSAVPTSAPAASSPTKSVPSGSVASTTSATTPTQGVPATPAPTPEQIAALTDEQIDAFIVQNIGADFLKQMRKLAEDKGVYVPKDESDSQFGRNYIRYMFKHKSEFASMEGKQPTEDDFVGILKRFSNEAYPKPVEKPQTQSFFSKVAGFFKKFFG